MSAPVIEVQGLSKRFKGKPAVSDFSMRVERGQIYGFLGPNGSGKTTTIRMLCGLLTPDQGRGTCLGYDLLREAHEIKRRVGYMTQNFSLYDDLSAQENLDFVARVYAVPRRRQAVEETLERLELAPWRGHLVETLSGGWKQRLALAACLVHEPELLLLDEPTAGVDPKARREFWDLLHALAAQGITILVSTHYMDEAERCHALAYLAYGQLLAQGTPEELALRSGLTAWSVSGRELTALAEEIKTQPGVEIVTLLGNTLRVSGTDPVLLGESIARLRARSDLAWAPAQPSLEEVFIKLMQSRGGPRLDQSRAGPVS